jgi:hypothetical protein
MVIVLFTHHLVVSPGSGRVKQGAEREAAPGVGARDASAGEMRKV